MDEEIDYDNKDVPVDFFGNSELPKKSTGRIAVWSLGEARKRLKQPPNLRTESASRFFDSTGLLK